MGFPLDLTELMAAEHGLTVDKVGYETLMENDRKISEAAEAARKGVGSVDLTMEAEQTAYLSNSNIATTDTDSKYVWNTNPKAKIVALYLGRGAGTHQPIHQHSLIYSLTHSLTHLLTHY